MQQNSLTDKNKEFFLPDFCQIQSLFLVLLIGELLAVIFTLLDYQPQISLWRLLGFHSLSIQIISLFSVSVLCWLRPVLAKYSDWISGLFSLIIILITTLFFCLSVIVFYWQTSIDFNQSNQLQLIIRNLFIAGIIGSVALRYFYLQQQYRRHLLLEASARLEALQARIRPHFLFNSMNVIASLTRIDPAKAETAIEDLSDLFRATLNTNQALIPLSQELENSDRYLAIEKLRLGDRLQIIRNISAESLVIQVPPLSVQPLLENAVYHGIQMLPAGGEVYLSAQIENNFLIIEVSNPKTFKKNFGGNGIALDNIKQRLEVIYSGKASLLREATDDKYRVTMRIPTKSNGT